MPHNLSKQSVFFFSIVSGPLIVLSFYGVLFVWKGSIPDDLSEEVFVILFQVIWTSLPFVALGLRGQTRILPWAIAGLLNTAFLIYIFIDAKRAAIEQTGANIGAGIFFIILPFVVIFICLGFKRPVENNTKYSPGQLPD
jgi:hypothetical protein